MRLSHVGLMLTTLFVHLARADFVVSETPSVQQPVSPSSATAPAASGDVGPPHTSDGSAARHAATPAAPRFSMALGFGKAIPLAFAVRQIVPHQVRVTFGPGVNRAVLVNWTGGQPWNRALSDAVRPLRLHLIMTYMAVEIEK